MTDTPALPGAAHGVTPVAIEDELRRSYLDYAMSVIVSRALPDARDGLKPVHRRILFSMGELNMTPDRAYSKSARVVGDVLARLHPHGDQSVYDALVRMAQDFSMRLPLVDGQGNFGSIDGDPAAAMRYTECRMTPAATMLLEDIDRDTVDFTPNYDGKELEPTVLPSRIPNLLVNGAGGIAVGMATNIPPHNLGEIVDACLAVLDDPDVSMERLLEIVPGPDFPTRGEIVGRTGARQALMTGRGSVIVRGKAEVESGRGGRDSIVITELPFQVNKADLVSRIAELVREKRVEGVSDVRDESDRDGMRVVIDLKRDASGEVILNQLYRYTALQSSFGVNMLALNRGRPEQMGLRELLTAFLDFREEVVVRRARYDLNKARDRGHVLVGLAIAVANIDEFIRIIRSSADPAEARARLQEPAWPAGDMTPLIALIQDPRTIVLEGDTVRLTDEQARAILALTLSRLTGLGREEIFGEAEGLASTIAGLLELLSDRERILGVVREELTDVRARFATPRRTQIVEGDADVEDEDLIVREDMVVTVTHSGYVKRTPLSTYRQQHRGGRGKSGMATKDEDAVIGAFVASTHTPMLLFTDSGKAFKTKVWRLPIGVANSRGKAWVNLLNIEPGDHVANMLTLPEDEATWDRLDVMFATRSGDVRRNKLSDFVNVNRAGKIAMKLPDGDAIVGVAVCTPEQDILLTTAKGQAVRFPVSDVRVFASRESTGVRGVRLGDDDQVISMAVLNGAAFSTAEAEAYLRHAAILRAARGEEVEAADEEGDTDASDSSDSEIEAGDADSSDASDSQEVEAGDGEGLSPQRLGELGAAEQMILTVDAKGFGKRSSSFRYRRTRRGGKGIRAYGDLARRGERLVASFPVEDSDQLILATDGGQLIRTAVSSVRIAGRATSGVTIIRTGESERVVSVERLADTGEEPAAEAPEEPHGGALGQ